MKLRERMICLHDWKSGCEKWVEPAEITAVVRAEACEASSYCQAIPERTLVHIRNGNDRWIVSELPSEVFALVNALNADQPVTVEMP